MNNEDTIIDPQMEESKTVVNNDAAQPKENNKMGWGEKAAYAVGGAVVGAGLTAGAQAMASTPNGKEDAKPTGETSEEDVAATAVNNGATVAANDSTTVVTPDNPNQVQMNAASHSQANASTTQQTAPDPEEAIIATATGVRVAQVDDNVSFSQAFADARAQVGPGGVFEWHGRAYSTYYKDEWDSMSPTDRAEFQASIDYKDVISDESMAQHHNDMAQRNLHQHHDTEHTNNHDSEPIAEQHDNVEHEVHVLETGQIDVDGDGTSESAALLEIDGNEVLVLDMNNDGIADVAVHDANGNYNIDEGEAVNISQAGLAMPTSADVDASMAQADNAPDYMNDADVGLYEA